MKHLKIIFLSYFFSFPAFSQNKLSVKEIDSLIKVNSGSLYNDPEKSLKIAKEIYLESKKNKYDFGTAVSLHKISLYYSQVKNNYDKAFKYNYEGLAISNKIKNDTLTLFFTFESAILYGELGFTEKAIETIKACLKKTDYIKKFNKRKLFTGDLYTYLVHFSKSKPEISDKTLLKYSIKAMKEYENVLDICDNPGYSNVGTFYSNLQQNDSAKFYLKKAVKFFKLKNHFTTEIEYTNLGITYFNDKDYNTAVKYLDSSNIICLKKPEQNYYLISLNFKYLKSIYAEKYDKKRELKYSLLELVYKDSLNIQNKKQLTSSTEYIINKNEANNREIKQKNAIILLSSLIVLLIIIFLIKMYFKENGNKMKKETILKEKEIKEKTSEIIELKQKVSTSYDDLIEMAKKNNPLFTVFFKELYPEFYIKLKEIQPELTILEQKICFYLKLKFSTKEIAEYTFVSIKAIQNRKNRLRKRLLIEEGKDIYEWFDEI